MDSENRIKQWLQKTNYQNKINRGIELFNNQNPNQNQNIYQDFNNQILVRHPLNFNNHGELKLFENNSLEIYVQKSMHQRHTKFQLQDSLYKIKVKQKENTKQHLLLKDLLEVFDHALKFILKNLKTFFKSENHHVAYLTLTQDPLVNGLNTG